MESHCVVLLTYKNYLHVLEVISKACGICCNFCFGSCKLLTLLFTPLTTRLSQENKNRQKTQATHTGHDISNCEKGSIWAFCFYIFTINCIWKKNKGIDKSVIIEYNDNFNRIIIEYGLKSDSILLSSRYLSFIVLVFLWLIVFSLAF